MKTYVVLLRGVMPVGKNRVPMAQLREVLTNAGFGNVRTYIASGNVLVDTALPAKEVERCISALIKKYIGPDLAVVARTAKQLQRMLDENPFGKGYDISRVFFVSFAAPPPARMVKELLAQDFSPDKLMVTGHAAYLYVPGSFAKAKLSNNLLEKKLGLAATTRNFNTLNTLIKMAGE